VGEEALAVGPTTWDPPRLLLFPLLFGMQIKSPHAGHLLGYRHSLSLRCAPSLAHSLAKERGPSEPSCGSCDKRHEQSERKRLWTLEVRTLRDGDSPFIITALREFVSRLSSRENVE